MSKDVPSGNQGSSSIERVAKAIIMSSLVQGRVNIALIAREAGVGRSFLYQNPEAVQLVSHARSRISEQEDCRLQVKVDDWRQRALNSEARCQMYSSRVEALGRQLEGALSALADTEYKGAEELFSARQQYASLEKENLRLGDRIRTLTELLNASRDVVASLDSQVADLEVLLVDRHKEESEGN